MERMMWKLREEEGAAVIEFALVATVFALLLFGIWDLGRVLDARIIATNAAREAAREGAIYGADQSLSQAQVVNQAQQEAIRYLQSGLGARTDIQPYSTGDVLVEFPDGRAIGEPIQVSVTLKVEIWSLIRQLFGGADAATIRGTASMRI